VRFLRGSPRESWRLIRAQAQALRPAGLAASAAALVPSVRAGDLGAAAPAGIRAQLVDRRTGALEMDFVVRGDEHATHVLNAVSPAWTSALAVAEHVVARMPV
jgi:L-2-hydroxyglutarate oxidase LhgO